MSTQSRTDWVEARKLHELEGWTFTAIAELMDVTLSAVSMRAKREHWLNKCSIVSQARAEAIRKFVERDSEAVFDHMANRHSAARRLQALIHRHIARLEEDILWAQVISHKRDGEEITVPESPVRSLVELTRALKMLDEIDASLLRDGPWQSHKNGEKHPPLPADFDWSLLRKRPKQEAPTQ